MATILGAVGGIVASPGETGPLGRIHFDNLAAFAAIGYGLWKGPRWLALAGAAYLAYTQRQTLKTLLRL